jgi:nitronate monooxygenase
MFQFSQLSIPIIQAPMAGGICTPELVAAVANAGGVGSFGFAYSTPQQIKQDLLAAKSLSKGPINANFFVFQKPNLPSQDHQSQALQALQELPLAANFVFEIPQAPFYLDLDQQLAPIWQNPPEVLSFHFCIPNPFIIEKAHSLGISVGITATNFQEAMAIEKAGADFIVAQGIEAGGHRGSFDQQLMPTGLTTLELVKLLVKTIKIPVLAAGGLMHGQDIRQVLNAGAIAAQLGTAFLCCEEAGTHLSYKAFLLANKHRPCVFTQAFSGRFAKGVQNEFITLMHQKSVLPFPLQNKLTASLRQWAVKNSNPEYQSLWAGEGFAQLRQVSAFTLINQLSSELNLEKFS